MSLRTCTGCSNGSGSADSWYIMLEFSHCVWPGEQEAVAHLDPGHLDIGLPYFRSLTCWSTFKRGS